MVEIPKDRHRLGRKTKAVTLILIFIILSLLAFNYIQSEDHVIELYDVKSHDFSFTTTGYGHLMPEERFSIVSEVPGTIYSIEVNAGDNIEVGDILFRLVNPVYESSYRTASNKYEQEQARHKLVSIESELEIKQLESQLKNSEAELKQREALFEAHRSLVESGIVSQQDFLVTTLRLEQINMTVELLEDELEMLRDLVLAKISISDLSLRQSRDSVKTARDNLNNLNVRARMNGVFQELSDQITLGAYISEGESLGVVADHTSLIAQIQIPSGQAANLNLSSTANILIRDQVYPAYVRRISPNVSRNLVRIDIAFSDSVPRIARPNLEVRAELVTDETLSTNVIRVNRFIDKLDEFDTFVSNDELNYYRQDVTFGRRKDNFVEIVEGAVEGDTVIFLPKTFDGDIFETERTSN